MMESLVVWRHSGHPLKSGVLSSWLQKVKAEIQSTSEVLCSITSLKVDRAACQGMRADFRKLHQKPGIKIGTLILKPQGTELDQ